MKDAIMKLMSKLMPVREVRHSVVLEQPESDIDRTYQVVYVLTIIIVTFLAFLLFTRQWWGYMGWG